LRIPLMGGTVPSGLTGLHLRITVAGRTFEPNIVAPVPNAGYTFRWDGKDAYGRLLQGGQPITVDLGYSYPVVYMRTTRFGYNGNGLISIGNAGRGQAITFGQRWQGVLGTWSVPTLGGWSLSAHHAYDPMSQVLYLGNGRQRSTRALGAVITTVAGNGFGTYGDGGPAVYAGLWQPGGIAIAPDGRLYIADAGNSPGGRGGVERVTTTPQGALA